MQGLIAEEHLLLVVFLASFASQFAIKSFCFTFDRKFYPLLSGMHNSTMTAFIYLQALLLEVHLQFTTLVVSSAT